MNREEQMRAEMEAHLAGLTERHVAAGLSPQEARFAALRDFGGVEQIKERCRDQSRWVWLHQLGQDLHYGLRVLRKNPAFALAAVLTLAIGFGMNATVFALVSDLVYRPVSTRHTADLVVVQTPRAAGERNYRPFSLREFDALRHAPRLFADLAAMQFANALLGESDASERRLVCLASDHYFSLLGIAPWRGRFFSAEEADPAHSIPVAVVSYEYWRRAGARPGLVGATLKISGITFTIIGIAPAGFGGLHWSIGPEAWIPLGYYDRIVGAWGQRANGGLLDGRSFVLQLFGLLPPGLTVKQAGFQLGAASELLNRTSGLSGEELRTVQLAPPSRSNLDNTWPTDESGVTVYIASAVGMTVTVLVVACLNVANMLLARGFARQREIALRLCLGASRARIVRQLLVEGLLLAAAGAATGFVFSQISYGLLFDASRRHAGELSLYSSHHVDWAPMLATVPLGLIATLVFALVPALRASGRDLSADLKQTGGLSTHSGRWNQFFAGRHCLIMGQIALSLVLLFSAGLLVHSVMNTENDRGFETTGRVVANVDYRLRSTPAATILRRQNALLGRLRSLPAVASAATASAVPCHFDTSWRRVDQPGTTVHGDATCTVVSDDYFATMGIPLVRGREFRADEAQTPENASVAIIDEALAVQLFGRTADPLGRFVSVGEGALRVVGVVKSPREDAFQGDRVLPRLYRPMAVAAADIGNCYIHVRLRDTGGLGAGAALLRNELRALDPATPLLDCEPLSTMIARNPNTWSARLLAGMFAVFGAIAVALAVIGVYSVKAYNAARRTREIGIRIAIGARRSDVIRLLLRQSLLQTVVAVVSGLALAGLTGSFLSHILYRVSAADAPSLLGATVLVTAVATAAALIPALRATRINPTEALRTE